MKGLSDLKMFSRGILDEKIEKKYIIDYYGQVELLQTGTIWGF